MRRTPISLIPAWLAVSLCLSAQPPAISGGRNSVAIDAAKTSDPITKYLYGGFIEHLGNLINSNLWSEMLDDRKFYYPVNAEPVQTIPGGRGGVRRWRPVGPAASVWMDHSHPYTGEQTPVVNLDQTARGMRQDGLALQENKSYTGRIVIAGDPGAKVNVRLIWGPNPADRQTISVGALTSDFAKVPLKFTSQGDTDDGQIEIVGTGTGSFRVGAVSLMPGDNLHGFRADTIALLKQMNSGFYRFPGGNFLSNHDWRNAIGDPEKRPPIWDYYWAALQPNDVGTDEFITMSGLLGVEPYISVNAGFGDARSAAELVEYANGSTDTSMGKLRAANGHPEPYHIRFWNIGNEAYGWWQFGHLVLNQYALKHNMFADAMRKVDPSITLIASGAMPDEMTVTASGRRLDGKVQTQFGSPADWTGGLLARSWGKFDMLAEHYYAHDGVRFDLQEGQNGELPVQDLPKVRGGGAATGWVKVEEPLVDWARRPANRVRLKAEAWEEYQKRFPAVKDGKITVSLDEWAYTGARQNLKLALSIAWAIQEMFRHTDFLKMSAYTMATAWINASRTRSDFSTIGILFKLYRDHFGTVPVEVTGNSPQPPPKYPVGGDQPRVNAGSPTYPLDVSAALSSDRKTLTVAIVNPTESAQPMNLDIRNFKPRAQARIWKMTGASVDSTNQLGQSPQVTVTETQLNQVPGPLTVPRISINLYEFGAQ